MTTNASRPTGKILVLVLIALAVGCFAAGLYVILADGDGQSGNRPEGTATTEAAGQKPQAVQPVPEVAKVTAQHTAAEATQAAPEKRELPVAPAPVAAPQQAGGSALASTEAQAKEAPAPAPQQEKLAPSSALGAISPTVTLGGTSFVVPRGTKYAGIVNIAAFSEFLDEARKVSPSYGPSARELIGIKYPWVPVALQAADIDIGTDPVELSFFYGGAGYSGGIALALELRHPERVEVLVRQMYSSEMFKESGQEATIETPEPGHIVSKTKGKTQGRLDVWVLPVDLSSLPAPVPTEEKSIARARKVTHVIFAVMKEGTGDAAVPDFWPAEEAKSVVERMEKLQLDPRNRFVMFWGAPEEAYDGFQVKEVTGSLAFPPVTLLDKAAGLLGFESSPSFVLEMRLDKPASDKDVQRWLAKLEEVYGPVLQQVLPAMLGGETMGADGNAMMKGAGLMAKAAFDYKLDGANVRVSLATRNITPEEVKSLEATALLLGL